MDPDMFTGSAMKYVSVSGLQTVNPFSWTGTTAYLQTAIAVKEASGGAVATPWRPPLAF
jgi:hypothetical protein